MKYGIFLIVLVLFTGCSIFKTHDTTMTEPVLLKQAALPDIPQSLANKDVEIIAEFLIGKDGLVKKAKLKKSSGDATWDFLAEESFKKWEFSPALLDGESIEVLIHRKIKLFYTEPELIQLAEITCKDKREAESVYAALKSGADFTTLVEKYSTSPTKGKAGALGKVDIRYYSKDIRNILSELNEEEFTNPLPYADHYVIFKKLKDTNNNTQVER